MSCTLSPIHIRIFLHRLTSSHQTSKHPILFILRFTYFHFVRFGPLGEKALVLLCLAGTAVTLRGKYKTACIRLFLLLHYMHSFISTTTLHAFVYFYYYTTCIRLFLLLHYMHVYINVFIHQCCSVQHPSIPSRTIYY